jgi:hypothetical protein
MPPISDDDGRGNAAILLADRVGHGMPGFGR